MAGKLIHRRSRACQWKLTITKPTCPSAMGTTLIWKNLASMEFMVAISVAEL